MAEQWRAIPGFPDYEVSDQGRVWSKPRKPGRKRVGGIYLRPSREGQIGLYREDGRPIVRRLARIMLMAFVGMPEAGEVARHLDDNLENTVLSNLAWGTHQDNRDDARRNGRIGKGTPASEKLKLAWARGAHDKAVAEHGAKVSVSLRAAWAAGKFDHRRKPGRQTVTP